MLSTKINLNISIKMDISHSLTDKGTKRLVDSQSAAFRNDWECWEYNTARCILQQNRSGRCSQKDCIVIKVRLFIANLVTKEQMDTKILMEYNGQSNFQTKQPQNMRNGKEIKSQRNGRNNKNRSGFYPLCYIYDGYVFLPTD